MALIPHIAPAQVAEIAVGLREPEQLLTSMMARARGTVIQELHTFASDAAWDALDTSLRHGASYRMLVNPHYVHAHLIAPRIPAVEFERYAASSLLGQPAYQHSKLLASSSGLGRMPEAIFTNVSLLPDSAARPDVAIRLVDDSAALTREYLAASLGNDSIRLGQAADDARLGGLLVNDPASGRTHLSDAMRAMVDGAESRIIIVSKGLDDADLAARLVQARARGVDVSLSLRDLSVDQARVLHDGGVRVTMHPQLGAANRINALVADDEVLTSTAYQWRTMLRPQAPSSRESGVLLAGDDARRAIDGLARTPQGAAALGPIGPTGEWQLPAGFQPLSDALHGRRLVRELH